MFYTSVHSGTSAVLHTHHQLTEESIITEIKCFLLLCHGNTLGENNNQLLFSYFAFLLSLEHINKKAER